MPGPITARGVRIGVPICEDVWQPDIVECIAETGGEFILVPIGSPYEATKEETRLNIAVNRVVESGLPLAYLNQIGGQDELVFDGGSFVLNADRSLAVQMPAWEEALVVTQWRKSGDKWLRARATVTLPRAGAVYHAMMLGCATMCARTGSEWCSACRAASTGFDGGSCGRCAQARQGALRDDAVALYRPEIWMTAQVAKSRHAPTRCRSRRR
jgi:NAD+ synthase